METGDWKKLGLSVLHSKKQSERHIEVGCEICQASPEHDIDPT